MQFVQPRITKSERITRGRVQERRIAAAPARAGRLTQAVLAKAFRGELVPTEAELSAQFGVNRSHDRACPSDGAVPD